MKKNKHYIMGPTIENPDDFYGRTYQVNHFFKMINGTRAFASSSVIGIRRSGKTSFLKYIVNESIYNKNVNHESPETILVYVNLEHRIKEEDDFYYFVLKNIQKCLLAKKIEINLKEDDIDNLSSKFEKIIEATLDQTRLVILLDEFENVVHNEKFDLSFFSFLRSFVSNSFAWITATRESLYKLFKKRNFKKDISPFLNVFDPFPINIAELENYEAKKLIKEPARDYGVEFLENEIEEIIKLAGRLPYFLQAAANEWMKLIESKVPEKNRFEDAKFNLLSSKYNISGQIEYTWDKLSSDAKDIMRLSTKGNLKFEKYSDPQDSLLNYGLLNLDSNILTCSELFKEWILRFHANNILPSFKSVFISYSHQDSTIALKIKEKLENENIKITMDVNKLYPGMNFKRFIIDSIKKTEVTILIVSENSLESPWVGYETIKTINREEFTEDKKFVGCFIDKDFLSENVLLKKTEKIKKKIKKIRKIILKHEKKNIEAKYLYDRLSGLHFLQRHLPEIINKLNKSYCINISESCFNENIKKLINFLKKM